MLNNEGLNDWVESSFLGIKEEISLNIKKSIKPLVIVFEIGHVSFPIKEENLLWAKTNLQLADMICKWLIQLYKKDVRIIPTILINNITDVEESELDEIMDSLFENNRYVNKKSVSFVSERNMKNRAYKMIKENNDKLDEFCENNGKMFLSTNDECMLPFGLVDETGKKIPRCGLIIASYMEKIFKLSKERLHTYKNPNILFVSFSEHDYEYERVKLGTDLYCSLNEVKNFTAMVAYWSCKKHEFLLSTKNYDKESVWGKKEIDQVNEEFRIAI